MDLTISGRHMDVTPAMEKHIRRHVAKLPRYGGKIQTVTVTLDNDGGREAGEVVSHCYNNVLVARGESHDLYGSIDSAFSKLKVQMARLHDRLISRNGRGGRRSRA